MYCYIPTVEVPGSYSTVSKALMSCCQSPYRPHCCQLIMLHAVSMQLPLEPYFCFKVSVCVWFKQKDTTCWLVSLRGVGKLITPWLFIKHTDMSGIHHLISLSKRKQIIKFHKLQTISTSLPMMPLIQCPVSWKQLHIDINIISFSLMKIKKN